MSKKIFSSMLVMLLLLGFMVLTAFAAAEHDHKDGDVNDPCLGTASKADLEKVMPTKPPYSPYAGRNFPTRPLFGDTHLHTGYSMDAGAFGAKLGPRRTFLFLSS